MRKGFLLFLLFLTRFSISFSEENVMDSKYWVTFGYDNAPVKVIQYYSLICPHCTKVFKEDFDQIFETYVAKGLLQYTYHPMPVDGFTAAFLECLSRLSDEEKRLFFLFSMNELTKDVEYNIAQIREAMTYFGKPLPDFGEAEFHAECQSWSDAEKFIEKLDAVVEVPSMEIGGKIVDEMPTFLFFKGLFDSIQKEMEASHE
ncbi:DsbA family protein [Chlamydiales bacterium]|nr:DsbA family protein [Chlamydiales bacterium]